MPEPSPTPHDPAAGKTTSTARLRPESKAPRLISLWQHPLGDVFGTGDGKRAVMLTMLDRGLGPRAEDLAACRARVGAVSELESTPASNERLARVVDVRRAGDGRLVITTPLYEGLTVEETLASGRLGTARSIAVLRQLCHALRPMHRAGLAHGALSPASVLLITDKGRKDAVRLVDVGVGAIFDGPLDGTRLVHAQPLTPEHGDSRDITTRSDIYRLGALAHAMLTGKPPFSGASAAEVMRAHLEQAPAPLTGAAASLESVVARCLAKDPAARFESVDALEVALCQVQVDASIRTVWDDLPRPPGAPSLPEKKSPLGKPIRPPPRTSDASRRLVAPAVSPNVPVGGSRAAAPPEPGSPAPPSTRARSTASAAATPDRVAAKTAEPTRETRPASVPATAPPLEPGSAPEASPAAPAESPAAEAAPSKETPATLEPVLTGPPEDAADGPADDGGSVAEPSEGVAPLFESESLYGESEPPAAESTEATAEYRKLDPSSSHGRARPANNRLPLYIGAATLGLILLGWTALRTPDDSSAHETVQTPSDEALHETAALLGRGTPADRPPNPPDAETAPEDVVPPRETADGIDGDATPPAGTPAFEVRTGDRQGSGNGEEPETESIDEPLEDDDDHDHDDHDDHDADARSPSRSSGVTTESASELAAAGKRARAQGNTTEAISSFRRALAKDGKNLSSLEGLGMIYFNKGDYKKAVLYAKRAVNLSPSNVEYRTLLGDAYFKLERYKDARVHYEKAAQRGYAPAKSRLEKVKKKLGG